jgi:hypothetical protein
MQFHQGSKLKKIIDNSDLTIAQIVELSKVSKGTLYNFFDYEEITRKKIAPILEVLGVDINDFYLSPSVVNEGNTAYGYKAMYEALLRENELLKKQLADKEEIISLLKSKK